MSDKDRLIEISNEVKRCEKNVQGIKEIKNKALNADMLKTLRSMAYITIKDILDRKELSR